MCSQEFTSCYKENQAYPCQKDPLKYHLPSPPYSMALDSVGPDVKWSRRCNMGYTSSQSSPDIILITLLCSDSFYNIWQINFQTISLTLGETSEKVLQSDLQMTRPADRFRDYEEQLESDSPLVHFHFAVLEGSSKSWACMGCTKIVFLFSTWAKPGDCLQQYPAWWSCKVCY